MIDPILSLTFTLNSNKGRYALLIGSGVSRSAGIFTGWEITLDLIRQLASVNNKNCDTDPEKWFINEFKTYPDYSEIINKLALTQAERCYLLKQYFEPTKEGIEKGEKVPKLAHQSIAKLVAEGFIKVIITTNFDRLIEQALNNIGIIPIVLSTEDAIIGAIPFYFNDCTIIKVHGDYQDPRIKNTVTELESYDKNLKELLGRIFDEYGLIVCGWSSEWDIALRDCICRSKNHRFSTYWTHLYNKEPEDKAKSLISLRNAEIIEITNADDFFYNLSEKLFALQKTAQAHPLSVKIAVMKIKKYILEDKYDIELQDLLMEETKELIIKMSSNNFPMEKIENSVDEVLNRMKKYEAITETLMNLMIIGSYWGKKSHEVLWYKCIEKIIEFNDYFSDTWLEQLHFYPALLLMYSSGLASIISKKYGNFKALMGMKFFFDRSEEYFIIKALKNDTLNSIGKGIPNINQITPRSHYLCEFLRNPFKQLLLGERDYSTCFDRFEYLLALVFNDIYKDLYNRVWSPPFCFLWRTWDNPSKNFIGKIIAKEIEKDKENWCLLQEGFFNGSLERLNQIKKEYDDFLCNCYLINMY